MAWYKVAMTPSEIADGKGTQLWKEFGDIFIKLLTPTNVALFCSRDELTDPFLYFICITEPPPNDPRLFPISFLNRYGAQPCNKPSKSDVCILIGNQNLLE